MAAQRRHVTGLIWACALALLPVWTAAASPSSALREYKAGKYQQAFQEYQRLLQRHSDDPRLHFNAGAAAYSSRQFDEAARQFDAARVTPDVNLQELAYYNHGNALFRLGEQNPDPKKKTESWEQAVQDYELALKLNAQDADAKFNLEYVKKEIEKLKQQQQKQNQQPKNIEPSEDAKRAKAAADAAVQRREYATALDIMQKQLAKDPTTAYYNDYIQRLKEVTGVQEAAQH